jgi:hypothetical protein
MPAAELRLGLPGGLVSGLVVVKGFDDEPFCADQPVANHHQPPLQAEASELPHR